MSDTERGCAVPLLQAVGVGMLAGLMVLALGMWCNWETPGWIALAVGTGAALAVFSSGVSAWRKSEFREVYSPPPSPPPPDRVRVELHRPLDGGRQTQLADLPASYDQLKALADGVMRGAPLSENTWSGGGRPFTRAEFGALRGEFLRRGWCDWRNPGSPGQGVVLSSQGKAVLRSFSSETVTPLPRNDD